MNKILDTLEDQDIGLLITIDEVTPRIDEMIQIAAVYQHLLHEKRKVAMIRAGLPSEVSSLLSDKSVSFLRRATQYDLTQIEDYEIEDAFLYTITDSGKTIDKSALKRAVEAIEGFPYMMQLIGYRAWQDSGSSSHIMLSNIENGIDKAKKISRVVC